MPLNDEDVFQLSRVGLFQGIRGENRWALRRRHRRQSDRKLLDQEHTLPGLGQAA
jgi:hypothetical protein